MHDTDGQLIAPYQFLMKTVFSEENYVPPNPPIGSGDRVQTRLIFTVFIVW